MAMRRELSPEEVAIADGREHATTEEFGKATRKTCQTLRKNHCLNGECYGIRPVKIGNRLLWPVSEIAALLSRGSQK